MKYFNLPPKPEALDVPKYIRIRYPLSAYKIDVQYILELFRWAESEYADTKAYFAMNSSWETYNKICKMNSHHVLASSSEFRVIKAVMTPALWNELPNSIRKALASVASIAQSGA